MKKYQGENVEKFYYLKGFLKGEALDTVKHLSLTNDSYEAAWELLRNAYENKNAIIEAHLATFMNLPTIGPQFPSTITQANTTTKSCLAALKTYQIMTETWDPIMVFILKQKLGPELRSKWEEERKGSHESAPLKEFLRFLDTRHKIVLNTPQPLARPIEIKPKVIKAFVNTDDGNSSATATASDETNRIETQSENDDDDVDAHIFLSRNEVCGACEGTHRVFLCPKLANNSQEALELVQRKHLCTNCLYKHDVTDCQSKGTCKICSQ